MSEITQQAIENFWQTFRETAHVLRENDPNFSGRVLVELSAIENETRPTSLPYPQPLPRAG